jgi:hypothetical protein
MNQPVPYKDVVGLYDAYKKEHHEQAGLARLLESEFGWRAFFACHRVRPLSTRADCRVDERSVEMLETSAARLARKTEDLKLLQEGADPTVWAGAASDLERKTRETDLDLKAARKRLQPRSPVTQPLLEFKAFVAVPVPDLASRMG